MFCRSCGSVIREKSSFCAQCGSPASSSGDPPPPPAPSPKSRKTQITILIIAGCAFLFMFLCSASHRDGGKTTSSEPKAQHKVGDDLRVGYWAYRCNAASWKTSIGSDYLRQYPDAEFLVIDLSVLNNDKTASILPPLKLVDVEGRQYEESSKGMLIENSFGVLKSLNPGVSSHGYVVFDVPPGRAYALQVSGGLGSGEMESVDLQ